MPDKKISLMFSIDKQKNDRAKELIKELGVNVEIADNGTPLLLSCLHNNNEMAKFLLKEGAKVNVINSDGDTPLILASEAGNFEIVKLLIENGADVNAKNKYGMTPIIKAISKHSDKLNLIEYLLKNGADPYVKIKGYENHPRKIADNAFELAKYLNKTDVLKLIKQYYPKK